MCSIPLLFNLYSDKTFKDALEDREHGIKIHGFLLNTIRHADDTLIMFDSIDGFHQLKEVELNINIDKTKFMIVTTHI